MKVRVYAKSGNYFVSAPYEALEFCRNIPGYRKWHKGEQAWIFKPSRASFAYLEKAFPDAEWGSVALERFAVIRAQHSARQEFAGKKFQPVEIRDFRFHTEPFMHQKQVFALSRDSEAFALLMEQGTGKSKVIIDTAAWLFSKGQITGMLVVCPNSVKWNWADKELPEHMPQWIKWSVGVWSPSMNAAQEREFDAMWYAEEDVLKIMVMNVEAFSGDRGVKAAETFLDTEETLMVLDESTRIKSPKAKRTKSAVRLGKKAKYRRILTGVPITQSPCDAYTQLYFLDPDILGFSSFYAFKARYTVAGGFENREIVGYRHLDEIRSAIDGVSFRVLKKDCLDLPEKLYSRRWFVMSPEYQTAYDQMAKKMLAEIEGKKIEAGNAVTKLLRLSQITGLDPERLELLLEVIEDVNGKVIIWARFREELRMIADAITTRYGAKSMVQFHGGTHTADRRMAIESFQDRHSDVRFFVGQQDCAGIGITLHEATTVIYYSNSYSLETRLQSEDRAHRIGLRHPVTYIDLTAYNTVDSKILKTLSDKLDLASTITGDQLKGWLKEGLVKVRRNQ